MVRFAPSSAAILRAIFRTSLSEKPIARSAFRSWQIPKKSMFGFITFSFSQGAALQNTEPPPAFEILMSAPVRRFFPEPRQQLNGGWRRARVLHPSEDLSELPPLRSVVAGQEYHCPRTRSLRGSLPKLLLDGWVPLVTFLGRLYAVSCTGGLRASSASLFHFWLIRLMSFSRWICTFQAA